MSFRQAWKNVEAKTIAFQRGAGDRRNPEHVLVDLAFQIDHCSEILAAGNGPSNQIAGFSQLEEALACALTDLMFLAAQLELLIPEAMIARNIQIRSAWKEKRLASEGAQAQCEKTNRGKV